MSEPAPEAPARVLPPADADRRLLRYSLAYHTVLDLVAGLGDALPRYVRVPRLVLPPGSSVLDVHQDWASRTFEFLVRNPAFGVVPECDVVPRADGGNPTEYRVVELAVAREADLTALAAALADAFPRWQEAAEAQAREEGCPEAYGDTLRLLVRGELARHLTA